MQNGPLWIFFTLDQVRKEWWGEAMCNYWGQAICRTDYSPAGMKVHLECMYPKQFQQYHVMLKEDNDCKVMTSDNPLNVEITKLDRGVN